MPELTLFLVSPVGRELTQETSKVAFAAIQSVIQQPKKLEPYGNYYAHRHSGIENVRPTFAADLAGFLADASIITICGHFRDGRPKWFAVKVQVNLHAVQKKLTLAVNNYG